MLPAEIDRSEPTPAEKRFGGSWKILIPFVFVPLLIVSSAVGVFLLFGKLADRKSSPENFLAEIRTGSESKRWQAAFELSSFLARKDVGAERPKFEEELLETFKSSRPDEKQLRKYLLIALAQVGSGASVPLIESVVQNPDDSEAKIYGIWALGRLGAKGSASIILEQAKSDDAGIRKTAAFSLGFVGREADIPVLERLLEDPVSDVRWNAALGLAELGSRSGAAELLSLLDLPSLRAATPNLRESERVEIVLSAVNAVGKLQLESAVSALQKLKNESQDTRLRTTADRVARIIESK